MEMNDREKVLTSVAKSLIGTLDGLVSEMRDLQVSMARRQRKIEDNIAIARDLMEDNNERD